LSVFVLESKSAREFEWKIVLVFGIEMGCLCWFGFVSGSKIERVF
jgi:hypothetical protein